MKTQDELHSTSIGLLLIVVLVACLAAVAHGESVLNLELVTSNLYRPTFLTHAGDGSGRLFVAEQEGTIQVIQQELLPVPLLDIRDQVTSGGELGLLGLAFHPNFASNRRFFVNYTRTTASQLKTVIAEYRVSEADPNRAETEETVILEFDQPTVFHKGGMLAFGPDGYLYIGTGDGGYKFDSPSKQSLLGKILRIDVDSSEPYVIPADNPFVGEANAKGEIWAYGFRNPWRFSFDRNGGRLFAADVGEESWEEVDLIQKGGNYGWPVIEGAHCFSHPFLTPDCDFSGLMLPIAEYDRSEGQSITGGYVYRGSQETPLWGSYLFGDFSSGRIWTLTQTPGGTWERRELLRSDLLISSFGEDEEGELYLFDYGLGDLYRLQFGWRELFAQVADGMTSEVVLQSTVIVVNNSDQELTGSLRFVSQDGSTPTIDVDGTPGSAFPFTQAPRSAITMETSGTSGPIFSGWAEVRGNFPFSGSVLFVLKSVSGEPIAEAGVASSTPGRSFSSHVGRESTFAADTALAIANPSEFDTVEVSLTIKLPDGSEKSHSIELGPEEQISSFVHEFGDIPADFQGTINVSATGDVIVTVIRTRAGIHSASLPVGP